MLTTVKASMPWTPLHWRHNDHDSVSNHQLHGWLLNRLFRRRSKKTSKLRVTGHCAGNSPGPVNSPHKGPVTRKMFPFDDVIMILQFTYLVHIVLGYNGNHLYICQVDIADCCAAHSHQTDRLTSDRPHSHSPSRMRDQLGKSPLYKLRIDGYTWGSRHNFCLDMLYVRWDNTERDYNNVWRFQCMVDTKNLEWIFRPFSGPDQDLHVLFRTIFTQVRYFTVTK